MPYGGDWLFLRAPLEPLQNHVREPYLKIFLWFWQGSGGTLQALLLRFFDGIKFCERRWYDIDFKGFIPDFSQIYNVPPKIALFGRVSWVREWQAGNPGPESGTVSWWIDELRTWRAEELTRVKSVGRLTRSARETQRLTELVDEVGGFAGWRFGEGQW